jgi:hypothetical protein
MVLMGLCSRVICQSINSESKAMTMELEKKKIKTRLGIMFAWIAFCANASGQLPESHIPYCCGVQLKTRNFTIDTLDQVYRLGFRIVRRGFYWKSVEREKGVYDFSDYDAQMQHARKLGLTVVGCLFGGNRLYEDHGQGGAILSEAARQGFARFAAATAKHYQEQKVLWEIWNEPNVRTFWRKDGKHNSDAFAHEYTALVQAVVPAMMQADPDCLVMAGSVSNYWEPSYAWTESCFAKGILTSGIRAWSVHPYGVKTPEEFGLGHARMRALLERYGVPDLPLVDTERGFAVKERAEGWSGGSKARAREFQGWHFVRQFFVDQMHGLRLTVWYEWDGDAFGLMGDDGSRPALNACRVMFEQLNGYRFTRRLASDAPRDYALVFENEAGTRKLVAWTSPPAQGSPDEAETHEVAIDVLEPSFSQVVSHTGATDQVLLNVGSIRLVLSGAPQYVTVPDDVQLGRSRSHAVLAGSQSELTADRAASRLPDAPKTGPQSVTGDLGLFDGDPAWTFQKNTGQGSFACGTDQTGTPIGIMEYDFKKSTSRSTPYVLAIAPVNIAAGTAAVGISICSPIAQQLTFRLIDSTGQTHQYKQRIKGTGQWEFIQIPLTRKLEHWGGANDGKTHWPIKQIVLSVPQPNEQTKTGKVEYSRIRIF